VHHRAEIKIMFFTGFRPPDIAPESAQIIGIYHNSLQASVNRKLTHYPIFDSGSVSDYATNQALEPIRDKFSLELSNSILFRRGNFAGSPAGEQLWTK